MVHIIKSSDLHNILKEEEITLIDVREQNEFNTGYLKGAILIPVGNLTKESFLPYIDKKVVIYCRSGVRSHHACANLMSIFEGIDVKNLEGGILAWIAKEYPIII